MSRKNIGELLLEYKMITEKDLQEGLEYQKKRGLRLGEALIELGKISNDDIEYVLSKQLDIPFVILNEKDLDINYIKSFPSHLLKKYNFLPLYETESEIKIVTDDPFREDLIKDLTKLTGKKVSLSVTSGKKIEKFLNEIFNYSMDLLTYISDLFEKLDNSFFYRVDFIKNSNLLITNIYGCGILKKYSEIEYNSDFFNELTKVLSKLDFDFFYLKTTEKEDLFISIYPVKKSSFYKNFKNNVFVTSKFGLVFQTNSFSFKTNVYSENSDILHTNTVIPGYTHYIFEQTDYLNNINIITTPDFLPESKNFYFEGYIPIECECKGTGCNLCNNLGYLSKELIKETNKNELKKIMEETYGKD
ncbi:hypothetical protein DEFDS_0626 [Deferribacter desulfuricans SSM1]|uniref:Type II secretion system protein GspE N-terminal domain-containing protein n=1 Tax=Deferribacter desulfuricans (strain DSM 14783 / JCM 11476 / NBRC 101012 / SSM1) TaxID=639282 RepID=D3PBY4_DEFDS|nr:hypothetical protein [Deferribacter desulfuricans]BAI80107.1 hypothetical protein DEFDS_0626 [Deferribacter desulfuricans SSM1]